MFVIVNATFRLPAESSTARSMRVTSIVRGPVPSEQAPRAMHIAAAKPRVLYLISPPDTTSTTSHVTDSAALYLDSSLKCEQVGTGDSPCSLGSLRPSVSQGVARSRRSSKVRTVGRGRK